MSMKLLKRLAREAELEVIERSEPGGLHVIVVGGLVPVHWWPESRGQTIYAEGSPRGRKYGTAVQVIKTATGAA